MEDKHYFLRVDIFLVQEYEVKRDVMVLLVLFSKTNKHIENWKGLHTIQSTLWSQWLLRCFYFNADETRVKRILLSTHFQRPCYVCCFTNSSNHPVRYIPLHFSKLGCRGSVQFNKLPHVAYWGGAKLEFKPPF